MKNPFKWDGTGSAPSGNWKPTTDHLQNQIDGIEHDLTEMKENIQTFYDGEFTTLKNDEAALGEQVNVIQSKVNQLREIHTYTKNNFT